jgi:proline iminopeptidase
VLYGQSWGGVLAIEYALAHQQHLKALVISNMMASIPAYNTYAAEVLIPAQDPATIAEIQALEAAGDTDNPRYDELLMREHYVKHVLRLPPEKWPEPVVRSFARINKCIYLPLQGPSELGASGLLSDWDRVADIHRIEVPTLVIGGAHDTMDPAHLQEMADRLPRGSYLHCPRGSHLAMYDDQETYMDGLTDWLATHAAGPATKISGPQPWRAARSERERAASGVAPQPRKPRLSPRRAMSEDPRDAARSPHDDACVRGTRGRLRRRRPAP